MSSSVINRALDNRRSLYYTGPRTVRTVIGYSMTAKMRPSNIVRRKDQVKPGVHICAIIESTQVVFKRRGTSKVPTQREVRLKVLKVLDNDYYECEIINSTISEIGKTIVIPASSMCL